MRSSLLMSAALASTLLAGTALAQQQPAAPEPNAPATPGPAQAPVAEPSQEQIEAARAAYSHGEALFAEGKYAEAKAAFEQAYEAIPNPVVLLPIAESEIRLGNFEAAHAALQRYLNERSDAPDRAEVEQKIADLLATPATLVVSSDPPGAAIAIDGQSTGKTTPAEIPVTRGDHRVELTLPGHEPQSTSVTARIGARHELHVALQPEPPPPVAAAPPDLKVDAMRQGDPTTALWITGIVGAAGIVTGTVLGFMALAESSDFDANPTAESADRGERLALFTDVSFGLGAMALLTGAVIYLTTGDAEPAPASAAQARGHIRVTPAASADGAGVIAKTRF